jgi:hypothetical protein
MVFVGILKRRIRMEIANPKVCEKFGWDWADTEEKRQLLRKTLSSIAFEGPTEEEEALITKYKKEYYGDEYQNYYNKFCKGVGL